jgi:dissimilatory sulfite reductase (desulfoviridin) alpha/beta subunit
MLTQKDIMSVKANGFLRNRGTDNFSMRISTPGTVFAAEDFVNISELSKRYGNGKVICTSRLGVEIPGIPFDKIPEAMEFARNHGIRYGGTGAKVRPIAACKGSTCVYGNIDTHKLAEVIHNKFYVGMSNVKLPHKFKIGVGGCPNSCMKPSLNDVGIEGCKSFTFDREKCKGCKVCAVAKSCPSKAVSIVDGKAVVDASRCTKCGVCVGKCPFGAAPKEAESACRVYVGGTWGKTQRMGTLLSGIFTEDEVPAVIEKVMLWYKENGFAKERLGAAIDRIGVDSIEKAVATNDILDRRDEILSADIKER